MPYKKTALVILSSLVVLTALAIGIMVLWSARIPKPAAIVTQIPPTPTTAPGTPTPLPSIPTPTPTPPAPITPTPSPVPVLASEDALWQQMLAKQEQVKTYRYAETRLLLRPFPGLNLPEEAPKTLEKPFELSMEGEFESGNTHEVARSDDIQTETIVYEGIIYTNVQGEWSQVPCPSIVCSNRSGLIPTWIRDVENLGRLGPDPLEYAPVQTIKYQYIMSEETVAKMLNDSLTQSIDSARAAGASEEQLETLMDSMEALLEALAVDQNYYIWIGEDGLVYQVAHSFLARFEGEIVEWAREVVRYYGYNDPTIVVEPPM